MLLVGGGLQNGLIALACLARNPRLRIALIERGVSIGGNHTWAVHAEDVPGAARDFVDPLIAQRWSGYDVRFPRLSRALHAPYAAITSRRFGARVEAALGASSGCRVVLGRAARAVHADRVELEDGETLSAPLVIDARGPGAGMRDASSCGFQKFLGLELELETDTAWRGRC